jgi:hypothetical protein
MLGGQESRFSKLSLILQCEIGKAEEMREDAGVPKAPDVR